MIKIRITKEALADIFTPGVLAPHAYIKEGLPKNSKLATITIDDVCDSVNLLFDDGLPDLTTRYVIFESDIPNETITTNEISNFDRAMKVIDA